MVMSFSSSEIYKIFGFSTCTIAVNYCFAIFSENSIFLGFYILPPLKEFHLEIPTHSTYNHMYIAEV